jgi:nitroreductase
MIELATATTLDVMCAQRACRTYTDEPVSDVDVTTMIEAATHAPSAENRQPWIFVVIDDTTVRASSDDRGRHIGAAGGRPHAEASLSPAFFAEVDRFFEVGHGGAPRLVVIAGDGRDDSPAALLASSVFPAVQNLLLAAAALGYGSTMTTLAAQAPDQLARLLDLPDGVRPLAAIPIGRPSRELGAPRRRPVVEIAHRNRFGAPFHPEASSC